MKGWQRRSLKRRQRRRRPTVRLPRRSPGSLTRLLPTPLKPSSDAASAGKSPFSADRLHLHHRLLDMGHTHLHAVLIFYAWTATASVGLLLFLFTPSWAASV